ncbi:MAG: carbohydrate kinase family protein [Nitrososphaerota archaeon]|nr:carbohydrate kinase family protein [Nitrososphaerota archaeon]
MTDSESIFRIRDAISKLPLAGKTCIMPDYFVDRFLRIDSFDSLVESIRKKSQVSGGGSIRGINQFEVKGGNAVNLGYALAKFGASVNLIAIASDLPAEALRSIFKSLPNSTLYVIDGKAGFTTAFEFEDGGRHVNVMISDAGDIQNFDGTLLSEKYWQAIFESRVIGVVNWAANKRGNDLCEIVFSSAKEKGLFTFFDPADVSEQIGSIPEFKRRILDKRLIDSMSLNENETRLLCKTLCSYAFAQDYTPSELNRAALLLSDLAGARIDLHTRNQSISCAEREVVSVECHKVIQKTVTGAGDIWDAADICGYLTNLSVEDRLRFANAAAGLYVSEESANPPALDAVLDFLKN